MVPGVAVYAHKDHGRLEAEEEKAGTQHDGDMKKKPKRKPSRRLDAQTKRDLEEQDIRNEKYCSHMGYGSGRRRKEDG